MFDRNAFIKCISQNLKDFGFGVKRTSEILERYSYYEARYMDAGKQPADASLLALADVQDELAYRAKDKVIAAQKSLSVLAEIKRRASIGSNVRTLPLIDGKLSHGVGVGIGRAAISMIEADPRYPGINFVSLRNSNFQRYWSLFADQMDKFGKGAFGRQLGKAHLPNIVRELYGVNTGDAVAGALAKTYYKLQNLMVDDFVAAGGALRKRIDFVLPQFQNSVKLLKAGKDTWVKNHMDWLDWNNMRWPDGELIPPNQRQEVLERVYDTISANGDPSAQIASIGGRSRNIGNMLDQHRFLIYKDADSWMAMHQQFGDGSVFDVIQNHIYSMAHKTAEVDMFGRNPMMTVETIKNVMRLEAKAAVRNAKSMRDKRAAAEVEQPLKLFGDMANIALRATRADPNSMLANTVYGSANVLYSAMLGSMPFLAIPGDWMQTTGVKLLNNQRIRGHADYLRAMTLDTKFYTERSSQMGYMYDELVMGQHTVERFSGLDTYGPVATRYLGEAVMRLTAITRHTSRLRSINYMEQGTMLYMDRAKPFDQLPYKHVMARYGIDAADWDAVRKGLQPWEPKPGAYMFRPLDILSMKHANAREMYKKFFVMMDTEAHYMVPAATIEARARLRGNTQPDTFHGMMLYSVGMIKNFALSYPAIYGRLAAAPASSGGRRAAYIATMAIGSTMVGATGLQLRNVAQGREPEDMDKASFWGRAMLAGGGLSVMGDFLEAGTSRTGADIAQQMAGPLLGFYGDLIKATLGPGFAFIEAMDKAQEFADNPAARFATLARKYTPGTSLWWARLALQRELWDRLDEMADPNIYRKRRARVKRQREEYGNEYYLPPGERLLTN